MLVIKINQTMIENSAYFDIKQLSIGNYQGTNARKMTFRKASFFKAKSPPRYAI